MTVHIFTGPTLSASDVHAICPDALVHGPIAHLDALRLNLQAGDLVGIIDGVFHQSAPVRHKELIWLMNRGVAVVGAASMGALRGAELHPCGMRGVGNIFEMYKSGALVADDEVAVAHAGPEDEYRPFSDALVNVRTAISRGVAAGALDPEAGGAIVTAAADMFFADRSLRAAVNACVDSGMCAPATAAAFLDWATRHAWNLKAEDATEMLMAISAGELAAGCSGPGSAGPSNRTAGRQAAGAELASWLIRAQAVANGTARVSRASAEEVMRLFAIDAIGMTVELGIGRLARMAAQQLPGPATRIYGTPEPEETRTAALAYCRHRGLVGPGGLAAETVARLVTRRETAEFAQPDCQFLAATRIAASAAPRADEIGSGDRGLAARIPPAAIDFAASAADFNTHLATQARHYRPDHIAEHTVVAFYRQLWNLGRHEEAADADEFTVEVRRRGFASLQAFFGPARIYLPYAYDQGPPELRWEGYD